MQELLADANTAITMGPVATTVAMTEPTATEPYGEAAALTMAQPISELDRDMEASQKPTTTATDSPAPTEADSGDVTTEAQDQETKHATRGRVVDDGEQIDPDTELDKMPQDGDPTAQELDSSQDTNKEEETEALTVLDEDAFAEVARLEAEVAEAFRKQMETVEAARKEAEAAEKALADAEELARQQAEIEAQLDYEAEEARMSAEELKLRQEMEIRLEEELEYENQRLEAALAESERIRAATIRTKELLAAENSETARLEREIAEEIAKQQALMSGILPEKSLIASDGEFVKDEGNSSLLEPASPSIKSGSNKGGSEDDEDYADASEHLDDEIAINLPVEIQNQDETETEVDVPESFDLETSNIEESFETPREHAE